MNSLTNISLKIELRLVYKFNVKFCGSNLHEMQREQIVYFDLLWNSKIWMDESLLLRLNHHQLWPRVKSSRSNKQVGLQQVSFHNEI